MFKVLGAHRASKKGMLELVGEDELEDCVERLAIYSLQLD